MTKAVLLEKLDQDQLKKLFGEVFKSYLDIFKKELNTHIPDELLTREQTCQLLQIDSSTLWHWTNKGKVKAYAIGNRRYYKRSEIMECLTLVKK